MTETAEETKTTNKEMVRLLDHTNVLLGDANAEFKILLSRAADEMARANDEQQLAAAAASAQSELQLEHTRKQIEQTDFSLKLELAKATNNEELLADLLKQATKK